MKKFDTKIQYRKYEVLREVAREAWAGTLHGNESGIAVNLMPQNKSEARYSSDREGEILAERVNLAMGSSDNPNVIQVIEAACDKCPAEGYQVTDACRGCIARHCEDSCRKDALVFDENHFAHIDKQKCVDCGACAKACPFTAIINKKRPCQNACKINAVSMNENNAAKIDYEKCISCGACAYHCPFGAIVDKSYILEVINIIKESRNNTEYKVYALVAPAISSQFKYAKLGQVISGIKELGFSNVVEAALGADMVAFEESKELAEKGFLTSSCCPAFVDYVHKSFPDLVPFVSHNLSPMATIAKYIKENEKNVKIVFIGPCTAKKMEVQKEEVKPYVDSCITFEELQALFDSRNLDITQLEEEVLDNASYYGRIFGRSGGLSDAVAQGLKEHGFNDFELKAVPCNGIEECRMALLKRSKNVLAGNFVEGMACTGGCVGGAGCLTHAERNKSDVDKYGKAAGEKTISDAVSSALK